MWFAELLGCGNPSSGPRSRTTRSFLPLPTASERSHDLVALGVVVLRDGDRSGIEGNLYVGLADLDLG
jgi:hypothetical protein